ncbi:hypothetical protein TNCV_711441 [Trichonephila clavipes]|nr:hypothetical protein TNCV_711441 [Trichonephila clavipes]
MNDKSGERDDRKYKTGHPKYRGRIKLHGHNTVVRIGSTKSLQTEVSHGPLHIINMTMTVKNIGYSNKNVHFEPKEGQFKFFCPHPFHDDQMGSAISILASNLPPRI